MSPVTCHGPEDLSAISGVLGSDDGVPVLLFDPTLKSDVDRCNMRSNPCAQNVGASTNSAPYGQAELGHDISTQSDYSFETDADFHRA